MDDKQKELALKILAQAETQPQTLYMGTWETEYSDDLYNWKTDELVVGCGTTRCIAGWAIHFSSAPGEDLDYARLRLGAEFGMEDATYARVAGRLLGLTLDEGDKLFFELDEVGAVDFLRRRVDGV